MRPYLLVLICVTSALCSNGTLEGCYKTRFSRQNVLLSGRFQHHEQCIDACDKRYFRYSFISRDNQCTCSNYLGEQVSPNNCNATTCPECTDLADAYDTGNLVPGPPLNVLLSNITNTSVYITWKPPESLTDIVAYRINANVLQSFGSSVPNSPEWKYPQDTFSARLILHPATRYNITLRAISSNGPGAAVSQEIRTRVGEPQNSPDPPDILKRDKTTMAIAVREAVNENGPITSYLIVVINADLRQVFQEQLLKTHEEANREGLTYYVAAELQPEDITHDFLVGDGGYYGMYHNVPLDENTNYDVIVGIVSKLGADVRRAFSSSRSVARTADAEQEDAGTPVIIIILSVAIALLSVLLVGSMIGFLILRSRVVHRRRHRLSDNQELTLQGPMIEVENNGYIPEDEVAIQTKADHYKQLKEKLTTIPYNHIKMEPSNLLGIGRYGRVNIGSVNDNQAAIYSIADKKLSGDDKKDMLRDLDVLIRSEKHENIIGLLGTCETPQLLLVAIESVNMNLKDLLLGSRDSLVGRFSNMTETQALTLAIGVAKGMLHLESNRIVHKQLCARNITVANGFVPKISGYGLAQYYTRNNLPDYTRWTALEVFKGQRHNTKSDVWSFACVLWEICVLGGTPYGNFSNNEVPERVTKGLRLPQMQYFSDDLYQIMLNCWQIDMDERPNFSELVESLRNLTETDTLVPFLNFNLYSNFQYEQYYPDMEIAVRPVF